MHPIPTSILSSLLLAFCSLLTGCGEAKATGGGERPTATDPKSTIALQLSQLQAGDAAALRAGMTERLRERITQELVDKAKEQAGKATIDELVGSVEMGTAEGKPTAKIMMKNGRSLTTLIETDGKWLADTIWFK